MNLLRIDLISLQLLTACLLIRIVTTPPTCLIGVLLLILTHQWKLILAVIILAAAVVAVVVLLPPEIIATVPTEDQTGNFGQDNQIVNPDINYDDSFVASNNQIVGVLDPSNESLEIVNDAYGIDPSFYTDSPIYSASDFSVGSSATATDFTKYADNTNDNNAATNKFGSTVSVGYGQGQVDPALAAAAGYTNSPAPGVLGNNATGQNSIAQTIANLVTPFDDTSYEGGILTTVDEARKKRKKRRKYQKANRDRSRNKSKDRVKNYKSGGQSFRGQGGR